MRGNTEKENVWQGVALVRELKTSANPKAVFTALPPIFRFKQQEDILHTRVIHTALSIGSFKRPFVQPFS